MEKFMKRLPVYNGKFTKEVIEITFHHFMSGTKMYFDKIYSDGSQHEITTQYGFKKALLDNPNVKIGEKTIDKIIADYNKEYITPEEYRQLHIKYNELYDKIYHEELRKQYKKKHPIKYIMNYRKLKTR